MFAVRKLQAEQSFSIHEQHAPHHNIHFKPIRLLHQLIDTPKRNKKSNIAPLIINHSEIEKKRVSQIVQKHWHLIEEDHNLRKL